MQHRKLGPFSVSSLGLGCMTLSHAYGSPPDPATAATVLRRALDLGYNFFDTAAQYGFGANETLLGNVLKDRRRDIVLASKAGMFKNDQGVREVNGRPDLLKKTCDDALIRLQTDVIDLYYLHRWDKRVPVEDSMGAMADLVKAGKVRTLGISEVSAATLRKAHAIHPITALQTEYSLWTRDAEVAVLDACRATEHRLRRVQPGRARLPRERRARPRRAAAQGHPPRDAALPGRELRAQSEAARRLHRHRARERLHAGPARARLAPRPARRTSSRSRAPRGSTIWKRTPARSTSASPPKPSRGSTPSSTRRR